MLRNSFCSGRPYSCQTSASSNGRLKRPRMPKLPIAFLPIEYGIDGVQGPALAEHHLVTEQPRAVEHDPGVVQI